MSNVPEYELLVSFDLDSNGISSRQHDLDHTTEVTQLFSDSPLLISLLSKDVQIIERINEYLRELARENHLDATVDVGSTQWDESYEHLSLLIDSPLLVVMRIQEDIERFINEMLHKLINDPDQPLKIIYDRRKKNRSSQ